MLINNDYFTLQYRDNCYKKIENMEKSLNEDNPDKTAVNKSIEIYGKNDGNESQDQKLRLLASEFTSILLKQMFSSMRNSVFKSDLLDGGFSEEVFTDMLDEEISKKGSTQQGFNNLGRILYEQLKKE